MSDYCLQLVPVLPWCVCLYFKCVCSLTAVGVLGAVRLRRDRRCWLRSENLRMDSLLREARERRELVLLKSPVPSSPLPPLSTELDKKVIAPWRERRTFPTHPDTWEWATDSLSPRYSITTQYSQHLLCQNIESLSCDSWCHSSRESLESSYAGEVAAQGQCPRCSLVCDARSILQQCSRWHRQQQHSSASPMWWWWWRLLLIALQHWYRQPVLDRYKTEPLLSFTSKWPFCSAVPVEPSGLCFNSSPSRLQAVGRKWIVKLSNIYFDAHKICLLWYACLTNQVTISYAGHYSMRLPEKLLRCLPTGFSAMFLWLQV